MPYSALLRPYLKKGLKWITSYLFTWRELLLRPLAFVSLPEDQRSRYTGPWDFAARTIALGALLGYVIAWVIDDPLTPPTAISVRGTTLFYANLTVFVALWMFFGVFIARAPRRTNGALPLKQIFSALTYLVVGTATAVELLCGLVLVALALLLFRQESVARYLGEHIFLLVVTFVLIYVIAFSSFFFTAWLVTKAIRRFYAVGRWRGIVIPAICWILVVVAFGYLQITTIDKLSGKEREALRELYVLSDLEAAYHCHNHEWQQNFADLKNYVPVSHECLAHDPIIIEDVMLAKSYDQTMGGYRFVIQVHDKGEGCLIRAHPIDYGGDTKLSFVKRCARFPMLETETIAQDSSGGDATRTGRHVLPQEPGWYTLEQ